MRLSRLSGCLFLFALLSSATPSAAQANEPDFALLQGLGDVHHHLHQSVRLERKFHLFVRLPESYAERADASFPTVYLLDGGITFPLLSGYYRYLSLASDVPDAILVGIAYGAVSVEEGNMRGSDFTAPSAEREHYGGASRFQAVLREEILPLIERTYRADPAQRVIFGQSLGGQFVLHAAQTEPGLFHGYIASNPALHRNLPFFLEPIERPSGQAGVSQSRLYVSSAENDDARFRQPALKWIEHWTAQDTKPWSLRTETLAGHNHFSAAPAAFRQGMLWIFEER